MVRRERTTGLPRARRKEQVSHDRRFAGLPLNERTGHIAILGGVAALLVAVLAVLAANWYYEHIGHKKQVILTVGQQQATLEYYADRLLQFALENRNTTLGLAETALLQKLEEEAIEVELARDKGVDLSKAAVDATIAADLGVPAGGSGTAFDTAYRQRLKTLKMSDGSYRKLSLAQTADKKLKALFQAEVGDSGETIQIRLVVLGTREAADEVVKRVSGGANLGTIAQTESMDSASRAEDGLKDAQPPILFPDTARTALEGKRQGDLVGPLQVDTEFWVFRIERRDASGAYTDTQKAQMSQVKLADAIKAKRATLIIKRNIDSGDIAYAAKIAGN
jgi:parvulin-like peptidyl-prolyl isomerase